MNAATITLIAILSFGIGANVTMYYRDLGDHKLTEAIWKYNEKQRLEVIRQSAKQANDLLISHRPDIAAGRAKFRGNEWGIALDIHR